MPLRGLRLRCAAPLCFLAAILPVAHATDAALLLAPSRQRLETADYRITGRLVTTDAKGTRSSASLVLKAHTFAGEFRLLVDVTAPASARQHLLLTLRTDGHATIALARPGDKTVAALPFARWSEGFLAGNFSYEDLLESQVFWPEQTALPPARRGARDCNIVRSTPGTETRTHYTQATTWLDKTIGYPIFVEKLGTGGLAKEFTSIGLRHEQGVWSASQVEATVRGRSGSTLLIVDRGSAAAHLQPADFSPEAMLRF